MTNSHDQFLTPAHQTRLLLAITDDDLADSAIQVADALTTVRGAAPSVIQAFDPYPYSPPPLIPTMISFAEALIGPAAAAERHKVITERIERVCGHPVDWPVKSPLGDPTTCIINEANELESELVIIGLRQRRKIDQLLGVETTIRVMTSAGVPVLAVTSELHGLPKTILIAIDFREASIHMAKLAARLVEPGGQITLAHVRTTEERKPNKGDNTEKSLGDEDIKQAFVKLTAELTQASDGTIQTVLLNGNPVQALLDYADQSKSDVIGVASQQRSLISHLLLGSVSRGIVRSGRFSVFVSPSSSK